ncbi:MAG TPA: aminotransferase class I/II-fold pyridoxal phosphate-dependent enzyme [Microthrixaceae bacterium]|nr:aminotransferase class I/II-fold pyridoxal phosphate-dependent enzyme [Microthrixaceae bacterium]
MNDAGFDGLPASPFDGSPFDGMTIERLRGRRGMKWSRYGDEVLPAWIAEPDTAVCPAVRDAVEALLDRGDLGYPADGAARSVAEEFSVRQQRRFGWSADPSLVRVAPEAIQVISFFVDRCTAPGEPVAIHLPAYPPILDELSAQGRRAAPLAWQRLGDSWTTDPSDLERAAEAGARALVLVNPHNPTGRVWRRDELVALAEQVLALDLVVLADEVHADLVHPDLDIGAEHIPFASLSPEIADLTLTLNAATKSFNLAGARCVVAHVGRSPRFDTFRDIPPTQWSEVSNVGVEATLAAWRDGDEWLDAFVDELVERRDTVIETLGLHLPELGHIPPEASFLAWIDCAPLGLDAAPSEFFLDRALVALSAGELFGSASNAHVRLNFATAPRILDEILERMVTAVDLWRERA